MATSPATTNIVSNLEYDWVTVMHNKAQAMQAYDQYIEDAKQANSQPCVELFQKLKQSEAEQVQEIREHLMAVMQNGSMK